MYRKLQNTEGAAEGEPGADAVADALVQKAAISAVNWAETQITGLPIITWGLDTTNCFNSACILRRSYNPETGFLN